MKSNTKQAYVFPASAGVILLYQGDKEVIVSISRKRGSDSATKAYAETYGVYFPQARE